jgi:hypothetical protein
VAIDVGVGQHVIPHGSLEERRQVEAGDTCGLAERREPLNDGPEAPGVARAIRIQVDKGLIDSELDGYEGNE